MQSCVRSPQQKREKQISDQIDKELKKDKQNDIKLLLLGTGESGKSTFVKQMKILYGQGFSEEERKEYKLDIIQNVVEGIQTLIRGMESLKIEYENPINSTWGAQLLNLELNDLEDSIDSLSISYIRDVWSDKGIKKCYQQRSKLQVIDSVSYFLDNLEKVTNPDFIPTDQDILQARKKTTGIIEYNFALEEGKRPTTFRMMDVGGQRSERRKWIHCFESVTSVIFLTALSEYDQVLWEDGETNRMKEAKRLFKQVIEMQWFQNASIILFLNKKDLFEEKIKTINLVDFFPRYDGPRREPEPAIVFIRRMFEEVNVDTYRKIYTHNTVATDSKNIKIVFLAVKDTIFHKITESLPVF